MIRNVNHGTAYQLAYASTYDGLCATFGEPDDRNTTTQATGSYVLGRIEGIIEDNLTRPARCVQAVAGATDAHDKWCDDVRNGTVSRRALRV